MQPLKYKDENSEDQAVTDLRKRLSKPGGCHPGCPAWHIEKTHGSMYMKGWPDLFLANANHGTFWVEMKKIGGRLEDTQYKKFLVWARHGVKIFILTGASDKEVAKLFGPANWWTFCDAAFRPKRR